MKPVNLWLSGFFVRNFEMWWFDLRRITGLVKCGGQQFASQISETDGLVCNHGVVLQAFFFLALTEWDKI